MFKVDLKCLIAITSRNRGKGILRRNVRNLNNSFLQVKEQSADPPRQYLEAPPKVHYLCIRVRFKLIKVDNIWQVYAN